VRTAAETGFTVETRQREIARPNRSNRECRRDSCHCIAQRCPPLICSGPCWLHTRGDSPEPAGLRMMSKRRGSKRRGHAAGLRPILTGVPRGSVSVFRRVPPADAGVLQPDPRLLGADPLFRCAGRVSRRDPLFGRQLAVADPAAHGRSDRNHGSGIPVDANAHEYGPAGSYPRSADCQPGVFAARGR